jgi:hypothetical protein
MIKYAEKGCRAFRPLWDFFTRFHAFGGSAHEMRFRENGVQEYAIEYVEKGR